MTALHYPPGFTCEQVTLRLERYLLSTLSWAEALALAEHLEACAWCGQALVLRRLDRRVGGGRG
jgi:hypothetical protein